MIRLNSENNDDSQKDDSHKRSEEDLFDLIKSLFLTLWRIVILSLLRPIRILRVVYKGLVKAGALLKEIPVVILHAAHKGMAFVRKLQWEIHKQFLITIGYVAIGKPTGIFLLILFSFVVTSVLYWSVNSYVLKYDHCFAPRQETKIQDKEQKTFANASIPSTELADVPSDPSEDQAMDLPMPKDSEEVDPAYAPTHKEQGEKQENIKYVKSLDGNNFYSIATNYNKEKGCVYKVVKIVSNQDEQDSSNQKVLFFVCLVKNATGNSLQLMVKDSDDNDIPWYKINNIASSNEVLRIQKRHKIIKSPVYPTNTGAFVSWLREYGRDSIPNMKDFPENDLKVSIAGELERLLENDWYFNDKTYWYLILGRSINGSIQFLSVLFFVAVLLCLRARNILFVCHLTNQKDKIRLVTGENLPLSGFPQKDNFHEWIQKEYKLTKEARDKFSSICGFDSSQLFVWEHGLSLFLNSDSPRISTLNDIKTVQEGNLDNSRSFVNWLLESIPALGFVGTVIGIGQTMMNTSSVLSSELGKQQSRISEVSMSLAFAFDTTLVALVLSLIASFFMAYCIKRENEAINRTQKLLLQVTCDQQT